MKIIAVCGLIGSGKDTVGDILVKNCGFVKLSFASALKDVVSSVFGWDRNKLEGTTQEDRNWREMVDIWWSNRLQIPGLTPRMVLQRWGTELFRNNFHPDIWLACIENKLRHLGSIGTKGVVITDCRFQNEIQFLINIDAEIVWIQRPPLPIWIDDFLIGGIKPNIHSSEYEWMTAPFSKVIYNNGTIEEFKEKIVTIFG